MRQAGVKVRYVIANPSSYAYFTAQRPVQFRFFPKLGKPFRGKAFQREGNRGGIVERKDRQQNDRRIQKDEIGNRIDAQGRRFHFCPPRNRRFNKRNTIDTTATIIITVTDKAEPSA